jgi:hypothetical protein
MDNYNTVSNEQIKAIQAAKALVDSEQAEMVKHTKLLQLTKEDLAYTIRKSVTYPWAEFFINNAISWIRMATGKIDRRKRYPEQDDYNQLVSVLNQAFSRNDIEILDIVSWGFDTYGWGITFTTSDDWILRLDVPHIKKVSEENMNDFNLGQLRFGYMSGLSAYTVVSVSYNLHDFSEVLQNLIDSTSCKHVTVLEYIDYENDISSYTWLLPKRLKK